MTQHATPYSFGDLLGLARRSWIQRMAGELAGRGFADYRASDAMILRQLQRGAVPVGQLGATVGVTRQAARKLARGLEHRGYATTEPDPGDARKLNVTLTPAGHAYAAAIVDVIAGLNRAVAARVEPAQLAAADAVLRAAIDDERLAWVAALIPPPKPRPGPRG